MAEILCQIRIRQTGLQVRVFPETFSSVHIRALRHDEAVLKDAVDQAFSGTWCFPQAWPSKLHCNKFGFRVWEPPLSHNLNKGSPPQAGEDYRSPSRGLQDPRLPSGKPQGLPVKPRAGDVFVKTASEMPPTNSRSLENPDKARCG